MRQLSFLLFFTAFSITLHAQVGCHVNVYAEITTIDPINTNPLWLNCTEDEPSGNNLWMRGDFFDVFKLVRSEPYNISGTAGMNPELFWFFSGCCGESFCVDDNNNQVGSHKGRIKLPTVNECWPTTVWINMMSQCEDCNNVATDPTGRWWKYERPFLMNELGMHTSIATAIDVQLNYQNAVNCTWNVTYGCDPGEGS